MLKERETASKTDVWPVIEAKESPRVAMLRQNVLNATRNVDIERARSFYNYLYKEKGLEKDAFIVACAKAYARYLSERTIYIEPGQVIVGSFGKKPKACPFYPEVIGKDMLKEYAKLPTRPLDRFEYLEEDRTELEEMVHQMNIGSIRSRVYGALTDEELNIFLKNPGKDIVAASYLFSLDTMLSGPGGHISPGYEKIIKYGLKDVRRRAVHRLVQAEAEADKEGIDFLNAAIITIDAVCAFSRRYAQLAREMAEKETDKARKAELLMVADACSWAPENPCRTFYEAVQTTWFLFLGVQLEANQRCYAVGRLDQFSNDLYEQDIAAGTLTKEYAQEIMDCFFMKFTETNHVQSENFTETITNFPAQQQVVCAGVKRDGTDACNEVTYHCIQATANTRFPQPSISVRLHPDAPDKLYKAVAELASMGTGHPSMFCDPVVIDGLTSKGYFIEDARNYSIGGCTGAQPQGNDKGTHNGGYFNIASVMELVLRNGYWVFGDRQVGPKTGDARNFETFEDVKAAFEAQMEYLMRLYCSSIKKGEAVLRDYAPTPFLSCLVDDCITRAKDRGAGGAFYNCAPTARAVGFADIVDSMSALKHLVFDQKKISMGTLMDALDANFEGYEDVQQMLMNETPKYGNDIDDVDELATYITQIYTREMGKYRSLFGGRFHPGFGSVSANLPYGEVIAALPTGRKNWEAFADGISPCHHADVEGPTAVILSASKLDHQGMSGGSILNMKFAPGAVQGPEGQEKLKNFIKGCVDAGFFHMQYNVNNLEQLRDAQKNPEKYPDLIVRVAGYSAFFTQISKRLQEDVIDRTCHTL